MRRNGRSVPTPSSPSRNFKGAPSYVKSFLRKGRALMGLGRNREAALALDEGGCGEGPPP